MTREAGEATGWAPGAGVNSVFQLELQGIEPENATFEIAPPYHYKGIPVKVGEQNVIFLIIFRLIFNF